MSLEKIKDKQKWDELLLEIGCFDTYHTFDYHNAHSVPDAGKPVMFVNRDGGDVIAIPLLERSFGNNEFDLTSVYGYAGPISNSFNKDKIIAMYTDLVNDLSHLTNYISLFSRVNSLTGLKPLFRDIYHYSGQTVIINLGPSDKDQVSDYNRSTRYDINKLRKSGFVCKFVNPEGNIDPFIDIYNSRMKSIHADDYYLFNKSYYLNLFSNNLAKIKMVHCELDGQIACVGIFFFCNNIVQYHLGANTKAFFKSSPTKIMLDFVREYASNRSYKYFHLGGGLGGNDDSLYQFKKGFSSQTMDFYVMKEILNKGVYKHLSKEKSSSDYFPLYRS